MVWLALAVDDFNVADLESELGVCPGGDFGDRDRLAIDLEIEQVNAGVIVVNSNALLPLVPLLLFAALLWMAFRPRRPVMVVQRVA